MYGLECFIGCSRKYVKRLNYKILMCLHIIYFVPLTKKNEDCLLVLPRKPSKNLASLAKNSCEDLG